MADCKRFTEQIFDYVDGLLPVESRKSVDKHIGSCENCADIFSNTKFLKTQLKNFRQIKTSPNFDTDLRTRIRMERSLNRGRLLNRPIRVPMYAATGALVIIAAFFIFNIRSSNLSNSNASPNSAPTFSSSSLQPSSNQTNPQQDIGSEQFVFPMEVIPVSGGTPLRSGFTRQYDASSDSSRDGFHQQRTQPVEF